VYELAVTCGIIEVKMGAYLWGGNGREIMDREAMNLACEGATEIENGGIGCIGMGVFMLKYKCGSVFFTL
jgi:hypothetical protein